MGLDPEVSYFRAVSCFGSVSGGSVLELSSPKNVVFLFTRFGRAFRGRGREMCNQKDLEACRKPQQRVTSLVLGGLGVLPWS